MTTTLHSSATFTSSPATHQKAISFVKAEVEVFASKMKRWIIASEGNAESELKQGETREYERYLTEFTSIFKHEYQKTQNYLNDLKQQCMFAVLLTPRSQRIDQIKIFQQFFEELAQVNNLERVLKLETSRQWAILIFLVKKGFAAKNINRAISQAERDVDLDISIYEKMPEIISVGGRTYHAIVNC